MPEGSATAGLRVAPGLGRFAPVAAVTTMALLDPRTREDAWERYASLLPAGLTLRSARRPFLAGWLSSGADTAPRLVTNAFAESEPEANADQFLQPLDFPTGSRGKTLDDMEVRAELNSLLWSSCSLRATLPAAEDLREEPPLRTRFEVAVNRLAGQRFAWLVVAEPRTDIDERILELRAALPALQAMRQADTMRRDAEVLAAELDDLEEYREGGLWRIEVLLGAASRHDLARIGPLLVGSVDLRTRPHRLRTGSGARRFSDVVAEQTVDEPVAVTLGTVGALVGLPRAEVRGLRLLRPPHFDVTPVSTAGVLELGEVLDSDDLGVGPLRVPAATLNRHTFICGATGSGKSQTARSMLESLWRQDSTPWLAVEPAKSEYARMGGRLGAEGRVVVIRPGDPAAVPASLNPLEPEPGYPLQSHADLVRALFLAAFEASEPFPQVLSQALTRCYTRAGWDLVTSEQLNPLKPQYRVDEADRLVRGRYPTLVDLQATARAVVDDIGYGKEVASDVRGFVDVRIGSLCYGTPGRFFQGGYPLDIAAMLRRNVVLELDPITSDQDKAFLMGAMLIRIVEHLRVKYRDGDATGLQHVLLIEEAHRLLKNVEDGPAAAAVELFASLLAEVRAYGEGLIIVEQIPSKIISDVVKNTALKVMHRLPAKEDRDIVGASINLTEEQSEAVIAFPPGVAAVSLDGEDSPLRVRVPSRIEAAAHLSLELPLVEGPRSPWLVDDGGGRLTLHEVNESAKLAARPVSIVWIDMVAAALIVGRPPLTARPHLLSSWDCRRRRRDAALVEGVERAVFARLPALQKHVDADDFAAEMLRILLEQLEGREAVVASPHRWRAGSRRWVDVRTALERALEEVGGTDHAATAPGHPDAGKWRGRGLDLGDESLQDQYLALMTHSDLAPGADAVFLGDMKASGLSGAITSVAGGTGPRHLERVVSQVCRGPSLRWILGDLATVLPAERSER